MIETHYTLIIAADAIQGNNNAMVVATTGVAIPVGDQTAAVVPGETVIIDLDRDKALEVGQKLLDIGNALPAPSKLVPASSMSEAERVANIQSGIKLN